MERYNEILPDNKNTPRPKMSHFWKDVLDTLREVFYQDIPKDKKVVQITYAIRLQRSMFIKRWSPATSLLMQ